MLPYYYLAADKNWCGRSCGKTPGSDTTLMVPAKFAANWLCDHPDVVEKIKTLSFGLIKRIIKNRKENENITEPELEKTANNVFTGLLKRNKEFLAACLKKILPGKKTDNQTDTGTIFREPIRVHFYTFGLQTGLI